MKLNEIRKQIDSIDFDVLKLLNKRMEFAINAKKLKTQISDSAKEQEILSRITNNPTNFLQNASLYT